MEGFFVLIGVGALICTIILPILTYSAVRALRERMDSLESSALQELRLLRKALAESGAPKPSGVEPEKRAASAAVTPAPVPAQQPVSAAISPGRSAAQESYSAIPSSAERKTAVTALAAKVPPPPLPAPAAVKPSPAAGAPVSETDSAGVRLLHRMWNWIVVGEEYRRPGLSAEFAIATTWLIRAAVLIAVFAVGFGLQLSIARGLLGPAGRVALALVCGSAFVVTGLLCMGKRYQRLGQGLMGGGLAMFYFAIYAAAMMFRLVPVTWAFGCMAAVTATAVVLAVRQDALSVAVLGALGGYLTPLVLKSAHPDLDLLNAYLTVLALGMAGVAVWRQWPLLTWLSLVSNSILFLGSAGDRCGWHAGEGTAREVVCLCVFFAVYSSAGFVHGLRKRIPATFVEIAALFANASITFGGGALLIGCGPLQRLHLAVLALGIAAFYVGHIWFLIVRGNFDRALLSAFIALAVIFMGIALPLLFTGHVLSAMFALQAVALLWIGGRLNSRMFTIGALCFYAIVVLRLALGLAEGPFFAAAGSGAYLAGLKERIVEFGIPIAALFLGGRLFRTPPAAAQKGVGDRALCGAEAFQRVFVVFVAAFYVGLIAYTTRELYSLTLTCLPCARMAVVTVVWALFAFHLLLARQQLPVGTFKFLLAAAILLIGLQWFTCGWLGTEYPVLGQLRHAAPFTSSSALPRLAATAACLTVLLGARRSLVSAGQAFSVFRDLLLRLALIAGFLYLTFETATCFTAYVRGFRAGAVSLVWGGYGLSLLIGGLRYGRRGLRMSGLALFFVTVGKVFLSDMAGLDMLYRLIAFGALGGVLLLAAYAYLRNQDAFRKVSEGEQGDAV